MPRAVILISVGLFAVSALVEGAITTSVIQMIEKLNPAFIAKPQESNGRVLAVLSSAAVLAGACGILLASTAPDGIQRLGAQMGLTGTPAFHAPMADYSLGSFESAWVRKATAGLAGLVLIYGLCAATGRMIGRRRSA